MRVLGGFYLSSSLATKLKVETWLVLETTFLTGWLVTKWGITQVFCIDVGFLVTT